MHRHGVRALPATQAARGSGPAGTQPAAPRSPSRPGWRAGPDDRGDTLIEVIFITPIVFFIVMLVIQFALWYHARQVVTAAAAEGARAARVATAAPDDAATAGHDRALSFIATLGGSAVSDPEVAVTRTATTVTVEVDASAMSIVPGLDLRATARSVSPVERFEPDS